MAVNQDSRAGDIRLVFQVRQALTAFCLAVFSLTPGLGTLGAQPGQHHPGCGIPPAPPAWVTQDGAPVSPPAPPVIAGGKDYLRFKVLVVVYTNTFTSILTSADFKNLQNDLAAAREFYWRNSGMHLHVAMDLIQINRLLTRDQFWELPPSSQRYWLPHWEVNSVNSVRKDLAALSYPVNSYDSVFVFYAWQNGPSHESSYGGAAYGVNSLLGKAAYAAVPLAWGQHETFFIHEFLHNVDSMFNASGMPEFPDPHSTSPGFGHDDSYSLNAWILSSFPSAKYFNMQSAWGSYGTFTDMDGDRFADVSPATDQLSITEATFGSSPLRADTDGDMLTDRLEAIAGIFRGTDPRKVDTDGDGIDDFMDAWPLDQVAMIIPSSTPVIDGQVPRDRHVQVGRITTNDSKDLSADLYMAWDPDFLYVAAHILDDIVVSPWSDPWWNDCLVVKIDMDADGYLCGDRNLEIHAAVLPLQGGRPNLHSKVYLRTRNGTSTTLLPAHSLKGAYLRIPGGWAVEVAIPRTAAIGLEPQRGFRFRVQLGIIDYDTYPGWPSYEAYSRFVTLTLDGSTAVTTRGPGCASEVGPVLFTSRPVLGTMWTIKALNVPYPSFGYLIASFEDPRQPIPPVIVPGGLGGNGSCTLYLDTVNLANLLCLSPFASDPKGTWNLQFTLPADPRVQGVQFVLQAVTWPPGGFTPTNGLTGVLMK